MGNYHNDQPITGSKESPDLLSRNSFAKHLSELLVLNPKEDCLIVSLEGEWGCGKTSIINLIKRHCSADSRKPVIVEYNPWLAGKAESLIQDFLVQFSAQLNIPDRPKEGLQAARELLTYSKLFSAVKYVPGAEPWASAVEGIFSVVGSTTKKISKLKELDLLGRKQKVTDVLARLDQPIIVVIDDIDRLTPDEAFQMMRLIKAVADFPGTTFLIAFDPEYLTNALERHGIAKSDRYLDKVVQLRVPLPLITNEAIEVLVNIELKNLSKNALTEHFEDDAERLGALYHNSIKYLINNPRDLKRIFNNLRLTLNQTEGNVSFSDLLGLSVLTVKAPAVYQHLKDAPAAYIGKNFGVNIEIKKLAEVVAAHEPERTSRLESCNKNSVRHISSLLKSLFPLTDNDSDESPTSDFDKLGRIASPKRLYIALHYQLPPGYAADSDIAAFILGSIDRNNYLQRSLDEHFVDRLFDLLSQNIEKIEEDKILGVLTSLYEVYVPSQHVKEQEDSTYQMFGFNIFARIRWLTNKLIVKAEDKINVIAPLLENRAFLPVSADILYRMMIQHGDVSSDGEAGEKWLEAATYSELKLNWISLVEDSINDGTIYDSTFSSHIYFILRRADIETAKELANGLLQKDNGLEKLVLLIGRTGSDSVKGPYTLITPKEFPELENFSKIGALAQLELDTHEDISPYFRACYLSITTGNTYYLGDATKADKF